MNRLTQPRFLFWLLTFVVCGLAVVYGYLINGSIFLLVTNEGIFKQIEAVEGEIINLEGDYLVLSSRVSMETAQTLGFYDVSPQTIFVNLSEQPTLVFNHPR